MSKDANFKKINIVKLDDLVDNTVKELPESDLCIQTDSHIVQFEYIDKKEDRQKYTIKPGVWTISETQSGMVLKELELKTHDLLETASNTTLIKEEANLFFSKLSVYKKFNKDPKRSILLYSQPGMGKCLHPDQEVVMFDGSFKKAKEVLLNDILMGPDSTPRKVLKLHSGVDTMYKVTPTKGDSYTVNSTHVLSLKNTDTKQITNIAVRDFVEKNNSFKTRNKGYRAEHIDFECEGVELPVDPYILGLWLGDGNSSSASITTMDDSLSKTWSEYGEKFGLKTNIYTKPLNKASTYHLTTGEKFGSKNKNTLINFLRGLEVLNNKHIPLTYKTHSKNNRVQLLAGLIDSDGYLTDNTFEITQKNKQLSDDILFVARSLGLAAYQKECQKKSQNGTEGTYYRVTISGDVDIIPTVLERKKAAPRNQIKNVLSTGIVVEPTGIGKYNGFTVDSDNLFLLKDFTVTHNSCTIAKISQEFCTEDEGTVVVFWDTGDIRPSSVSKFLSTGTVFSKDCTRMLFIMEDIGGGNAEDYHGPKTADAGLLELLDGASVSFRLPTFIIATTNTPENLLQSLADRPGRFDQMFELEGPNSKERVLLAKHIAKRDVTEEEKTALESKDAEGLSIAHISEIIVRSALHDKSFADVIIEMKEHKEKIERAFAKAKKRKLGLG